MSYRSQLDAGRKKKKKQESSPKPSLSDFLPSSLKEITFLLSRCHPSDLFDAIRRLILQKSTHFPNLTLIAVQGFTQRSSDIEMVVLLETLAHAHNIELGYLLDPDDLLSAVGRG